MKTFETDDACLRSLCGRDRHRLRKTAGTPSLPDLRPTGAGKTTILDAMCYALYGKTSGDRTGEKMRSDYADSSERTEVIFDFMLGDKTYRATRSPAQMVDKKRGSGQTLAAMQASLSELEDGKEINTLRTGIEEAAGKLIGLNADQFCQVILLPQGDFRKLLVQRPMKEKPS